MNEKTILFQYNVDMDGNPVSVKLKDESQVSALKYNIQLEQLPDEQYGVVVLDASGKSMKEVYNYDDLENKPNAYYVNYTTGVVHFNSSQSAERKIINYYGTGVELISAKRVFDGYYNASGEWIYKTLQEIIDAGREAIEAMTTIGNASIILQNLSDKIAEGNIVVEELTNLKQEITQAINVTGNEVVIINAGNWVYNPTNNMYEHTINHTMNSKDLIIDCYNLATGDFVLCGGKIVNNNSVLIKSETNIDLKVVLNARYYKATLTISDDIAREVVDARKTYGTVGERLDNFDSQLDTNTSVTNYSIYSTNKENRKTIILGHRGLMSYYPENTLMAFKNCVLSGFSDGFELDIRESSDKVLYCMHDTTVDRTTNGSGAIKELTSSYINTLDASCKFDFHFPNVGVPTFERVVKESSRYKPIIMCHIFPNEYNTIEDATDYIKRVIDIIKKYDMESYCYLTIQSNSKTYYPIVRNFSKKIRLNISTNSGFNQEDGYYSLRDYYKEIKDTNIILSTIYDFWVNNPRCIEELHSYNIGVGCDNPKTYPRLQDLLYRGFDVICTDNMSKELI